MSSVNLSNIGTEAGDATSGHIQNGGEYNTGINRKTPFETYTHTCMTLLHGRHNDAKAIIYCNCYCIIVSNNSSFLLLLLLLCNLYVGKNSRNAFKLGTQLCVAVTTSGEQVK
uniref:Uncharacterized protein n=1 Tax=Glossina pallidipes TaxID=7398 RepID=A0A1B0ADT7_GLOPL